MEPCQDNLFTEMFHNHVHFIQSEQHVSDYRASFYLIWTGNNPSIKIDMFDEHLQDKINTMVLVFHRKDRRNKQANNTRPISP